MHKSANYIPSPVAEGEVTLEVEVDALSRDGGARSATEQAVPLAAQADNASAAHRTHSGPSSVLGTDTRSEAGSDDDDETNQDVLRNAGLAIDPELADPDANEEELALEASVPWIRRKGNALKLFLNVISVLVILGGVVLATPVSPEQIYAFRWPIFFGAIIPIFFLSKLCTHSLYHWIEVHYFKEQLFHFSSMKKSTRNVLFFSMVLLWYFLVFELLWCRHTMYNGVCKEPAYREVTRIMMKIILCLTLASLATFLAALAAKMISTHFLKSTHFKKLHMALEKEHYLKTLSNPKLRREPPKKADKSNRDSQPRNGRDSLNLARISASANLFDGPPASISKASQPHSRARSFDDADPILLGRTSAQIFGKMPKQNCSADNLATPFPPKTFEPLDLGPASRFSRVDTNPQSFQSSGVSSPTSGSMKSSAFADAGDDVEMTIGQSILEGINLEMLADERDLEDMTEEEVDRLRTAVVIKTSSAMMRQHKFRTKEEKAQQLKNTQAFGKILFFTIRSKTSHRPFITYHDVKQFFPDTPEGKKNARSAFSLFAVDRKSKVTMQQVMDTVMAIHKDRSNISASLNNTTSMIKSLQMCLAAGLHFLFLALYLVIWRIDVVAGFSAFSATVLALSFIFGNTIRNLFESMLFLFVEHPYDIGDWVEVDGKSYEVVKISLMNTTFHASGKIRAVIPNASLIPKEIRNLSRIDNHLEIMTIQVDFGMVEVVKDDVRKSLQAMVKEFSNDYMPVPIWVVYTGVDRNMKANLLVLWAYACAPADWDRKHPARDRAVTMVTGIVAKHHANGATYTTSHRIVSGFPAEVAAAVNPGSGVSSAINSHRLSHRVSAT